MIDAGAIAPDRQLTFEFAHRIGMSLVDFMPAPSNRQAYDLIMAWPEWPTVAVVLHGPIGSGRTHLAHIWAERASACFFDAAEIWEEAAPLERLGSFENVVVDGADQVLSELPLFHLYNAVTERRGNLLLVGDHPPGLWRTDLPDLHSRLQAALPVAIEAPCDDLLAALLVKQFSDRQVRIEPAVVTYLVRHMERSFAAVRRITVALDRVSLCAQRPITLPLARRILEALQNEDDTIEHAIEQ
ncbi:MAG: DnaA/Hda family protein [Pseudomonadota bacterium]